MLCPTNVDYTEVENLTEIRPLSSPAVLQCLEARHQADLIYTHAGSTLVAVNPFCQLPGYYGNDAIHCHLGNTLENEKPKKPHIYAVAAEAYHQMSLQTAGCLGNQSIIVSGESGAGKTVSAKHLMKFLVTASSHSSGGDVGSRVERRILDSNPILEAFGNACTLRNHNSSRFGKYTQMHFDRKCHLVGAAIETYLLEKTRLVHQADGESNFHIFYQMLCGLSLDQRSELYLDQDTFLWADTSIRQPGVDLQNWLATQEAMNDLGLTSTQQSHILQVLSGLLHLGNVMFCPDEEDEDICVIDVQGSGLSPENCVELLGLDLAELEVTFTHRRITATHRRRKSVFSKPCTLAETTSRRDCLAKLLYAKLFEWLVQTINSCILPKDTYRTIGLLDIYGFESFQENNLEQLCINYANEKLQQHYVIHFLKELQAEYEEEAISWEAVQFADNRQCLDLLEGAPGVFSVINEECQLNRECGPEDLLDRMVTSLQPHPHLTAGRKHKHTEFVVKHYASPVTYTTECLLEKNKDNVPAEVVEVLKKSRHPFVSALFSDVELDQPGKKKKTVLAKFKSSLDALMVALTQTQAHYVRCIKPNPASQPHEFDRQCVFSQLQACGVVETVDICRRGFPNRMLYEDFLSQYSIIFRLEDQLPLKKTETKPREVTSDDNKENELLFEPIDMLYQKQLQLTPKRKSSTPKKKLRRRAGLSSSDHSRKLVASIMRTAFGPQYSENPSSCMQFGRTKIFLKEGQLEQLESMRMKVLSQFAFRVQCAWRRHRNRRRRRAAIIIQSVFRGWHIRRENQKKSSAAYIIQRAVRQWLEQKHWTNQDEAELLHDISSLMSPVHACSALSLTSSPRVDGDHEGFIVCKEQTPEGLTYHIMPSPVQDRHYNQPDNCGSPLLHTSTPRSRGDGDSLFSTPQNKRSSFVPLGMTYATANDAFRTVGAAVSAAFLTQQRFAMSGAFRGIPYIEAKQGILSRRRMPRVQIKFHTRPNPLLKYGHYISRHEFQCSLSDCLKEYD